jgi:hypothetical protein
MNFKVVDDDDPYSHDDYTPKRPRKSKQREYERPIQIPQQNPMVLIGIIAVVAIMVFGGFMLAKAPSVNAPNVSLSCPELLVPACPSLTCPEIPACPVFVVNNTNITEVKPANFTISVWNNLNTTQNLTQFVNKTNNAYTYNLNLTNFTNITDITVMVV